MSTERKSPCGYHPYQNHTWIQLHEVVIEKEYQLECSKDELQKLSVYESESKRKDEVILALRKETTEYKKCTQSRAIRHASLEDQIRSNESHLQEHIKEVHRLQLELESAQGKLRSTSSKCDSVQKEVSRLSQVHLQQNQELRDLKKQQKSDEESIATLKRELAEKKRTSASLHERANASRSENKDLQKRCEGLQTERESMVTNEKRLREEIGKMNALSSNGKLLQAKCDFTEQELLKAKDKENTLAVELGRVESELSDVCGHVLASFQVPRAEDGASSRSPHTATHVVTQFAEDYFKMEERLGLCEQELEECKENQTAMNDSIFGLRRSWEEFKDGIPEGDFIGALRQLSECLQKTRSKNEDITELLDIMRRSIDVLCSMREQSQVQLSHLESHIRSCYNPENEGAQKDVFTVVSNMAASIQSSGLQTSRLKEQLIEIDLEHNASLSGAVTALRQDELKRMNDAIEKTKIEEKERLCRELESARQLHAVEKQEALSQEQEIVAVLTKEVEALKMAVEASAEDSTALKAKLVDMELKLAAAEQSKSQADSEAESCKETLQQHTTTQIAEYKEQAQQYAYTIVAMEEKLLGKMESFKVLKNDNQCLKEQLGSVRTASTLDIEGQAGKILKLEELTAVLRKQLSLACEDGSKTETAIKQLEDNLIELNKKAGENQAQLEKMHREEISDLQLTMARQEAIIECQKTELDNLVEKLNGLSSELDKKSRECANLTEQILTIKKKLEEKSAMGDQQTLSIHTEAGHMCIGEKHADIISNQKTAIAQLREKVAELELARPPIGSHQATLKELSRVRHELLKAKSSAARPGVSDPVSSPSMTFKPQLTFMEENKSQETALHQLEDTLQCSERVYKNLVDAICKAMPDVTRHPLEDADQLIPADEQSKKKQVLKDRKKFVDTVYRQLSRQAKLLVSGAKSDERALSWEDSGEVKAEGSEMEEKSPTEVIKDLECVLSATVEELEQQKRLNQSLLKRKNFKEMQHITSQQRPRHKCEGRNNHHRTRSHQDPLV